LVYDKKKLSFILRLFNLFWSVENIINRRLTRSCSRVSAGDRNQLEGLARSVELGLITKVNTVLIPTINDHHIIGVAKKIRGLGIYLQNIMPLIPQYKFADIAPPTLSEKRTIRMNAAR
jgi:MoaA/NifB/PqqE/SkfB family radical SAM enzyme